MLHVLARSQFWHSVSLAMSTFNISATTLDISCLACDGGYFSNFIFFLHSELAVICGLVACAM